MKRVFYKTLGCKLNQADTELIAEILKKEGIAEISPDSDSDPEIIFINTCAVTCKAEAKSRHAVSKASRDYPEAIIIAAGCLAQLSPESLSKIPGINYILGTSSRFSTRWWRNEADLPIIDIERGTAPVQQDGIGEKSKRSRPFLKIQDGCNQQCTFCIIPHLRGRNRSVARGTIIERAQNLIGAGACEIVLTGVRIGAWGQDSGEKIGLAGLIRELTEIDGDFRIRLGSVEPWEVDRELIKMVTGNDKVCPHIHVSFQHTSKRILKLMNRPDISNTLDLLHKTRYDNPNIGLGVDLIAGFPGETEEEFQQLLETITDFPLTYLHAFGYSRRPGTPAAEMKEQIASKTIKDRTRKLIEIGKSKQKDFLTTQISRTLSVIPDKNGSASGWVRALSGNYIKVLINNELIIKGKRVNVKIAVDDKLSTVGTIE